MGRFCVVGFISSFSVLFACVGSGSAAADDWCYEIHAPTTINTNRRCVVVDDPINGSVVNNATVGKFDEERPGFFIDGDGLITGSLTNNGTITGGGHGLGALTLGENADVAGGIFNNGTIVSPYGNAISLGYRHWSWWSGWHTHEAALTGDIVNGGAIDGHVHGLAALYGTMTGALVNEAEGSIQGGDIAVYVADSFTSWTGGIENRGLIEGEAAGIQIGSLDPDGGHEVVFAGGIVNGSGGEIKATSGPAVALGGQSFSGGVDNAGTIEGAVGLLFTASAVEGGISNDAGGVIAGNDGPAIWIDHHTATFAGGIDNKGKIQGATNALLVDAQQFLNGIVNATTGEILGYRVSIRITGGGFSGGIQNHGLIHGGTGGISVESDTFDGGLFNGSAGSILADDGDAVFASAAWTGDFENEGTVSGAARGFAYVGPGFDGNVDNSGTIEGGSVAFFMATSLFDGAFLNDGSIEGGLTGVQLALGQATGGFTNGGDIEGVAGSGVRIEVQHWGSADARADIRNTASGTIVGGETGFWLSAFDVFGDFINDGGISGGGVDTGLSISAASFSGDIVNNGDIDAPTNALVLQVGTLDGEVVNTGDVRATNANGVAVALAIGNGATFTNRDGGVLHGDVLFSGDAGYHFIGEDGGVEGDLVGEGGDDAITVRNGAQYFVAGAGGGGLASDFASFTVEDGGVAILGARFAGDAAGTGYTLNGVDNMTVRNGGMLYVDKATAVHVDDSFALENGGTLAFFLGAPGGGGFSDLTGIVVAAPEDYGHILVEGSVALDGNLVGYLDPAFASANDDLEQVLYNDVIVAQGGISGGFSTVALIADSSLFELNGIVDGNSVDFEVTRTTLEGVSSIVVNLGGPFDALVNDRSNGMSSGSCALSGEGWCLNRFAANDPGATQVMTDATPGDDPFAWLRTGTRQVGETSFWGRAVGVWGETDGDAGADISGSEFDVAGAIVGVDHVFTPELMLGVAAQWTTTDIGFTASPNNADVDSLEAGAYVSYGDARLYLNANGSVIFHTIDVRRFGKGGQAHGDYDGTTLSAFSELGKIFETEEGLRIQPFVSLSYSHLETDAYSETGTGVLLNVFGSTLDSLRGMLGLRVGYPIELESGRRMVPEARVGWVHEFMDDQASFLATIQGQNQPPSQIFGERFARDTVMVGAGLAVPITASWTIFIDYDASLNPDIQTHTASAGVRASW